MDIDFTLEKLSLITSDHTYSLHPLWVRERSKEQDAVDQSNLQRLYNPETITEDLKFKNVERCDEKSVIIHFSDEYKAKYCLHELLAELNRDQVLPNKVHWDAKSNDIERLSFSYEEDETAQLINILDHYHKYGFVIVEGLKAQKGEVSNFAERIGFIRETNFGKTFDVVSVQNPIDQAYTSVELGSHTDNPYRKPVPSIQFLLCIENTTIGGDSTIVDGYRVAEDLKKSDKKAFETLSNIIVKFKYQDKDSILEDESKIINLNDDGSFLQIRFNNRHDFVFYDTQEKLTEFYRAKRKFHKMINSKDYLIQFRLPPGGLLIVDNYRVLHGRTSFKTSKGNRFLQGLYIDHDSMESKYKILKVRNNGQG